LVVIAAAALLVHYYFLRADLVGVYSPARGWHGLTGRALPPLWHYLGSGLALSVVPVLAARWITGLHLAELGLGLGRWREGLVWLAAGVPLAVLAGMIGAASVGQRAVYPLDPTIVPTLRSFAPYAVLQFLYYGSWEVLFRAVLLFGLRGAMGNGPANLVQTGISVTAHFGRSLDETLPSLPAGLVFGWLALRLRSVWVVALLHWVTGVSQDWFILHH
jgi:membrane protease YdiL (CAAX protease family)